MTYPEEMKDKPKPTNDPITMKIIKSQYWKGELRPFLVYGDLGIGKSSFCIQQTAMAYGKPDYPNWEKMKERIVHKPIEFFKDCLMLMVEKRKEICLDWEDAGVWLFAMEYNKPLIMAFTKYLNLARTRYGSIKFNAPTTDMVIKKIRMFPTIFTVKIIKEGSDLDHPRRRRIARVFRPWRSDDGKKFGVKNIYNERFNAMLPNDIYKWYMPIRESYEEQAIMEMWKVLKDSFEDKEREELEPIVNKVISKIQGVAQDQVYELLNLEPSFNVKSTHN